MANEQGRAHIEKQGLRPLRVVGRSLSLTVKYVPGAVIAVARKTGFDALVCYQSRRWPYKSSDKIEYYL